jgi:hypothetical protein
MAFNGSGTFVRLYTWATDKINSIPITASRIDAEDDGFATGLSNCITKDGQTTVTANIPMNSKKFTGLTVGTARTDSISLGQVQDGTYTALGTTGGSADAYTSTPSPTITAYVATQRFSAKIHATNATTTPTLAVSGLTAATIKKFNSSGSEVAVAASDLIVGTIYDFMRNPANDAWIVLNPSIPFLIGANIASVSANKNIVINGDFNIWQRGTSFATIADGTYTADRWVYGKVGSMVHTVSRSTDVPTVAEAGRLFNYSLLIDCTTVDASIASGDVCGIEHKIEGYNFLPLAQKIITLSFWVKATKTGIYCASFRNNRSGTPDRSYIGEYTINSSNTWEYKTITIAASPSAGTWNYTDSNGLSLTFVLAAGSTFQTTANAWQTGNFFATANQVNATDSDSNDFRIAGVQLEKGSFATPFEQRTTQEELDLCLRYFERIGGDVGNAALSIGFAATTTVGYGIIPFKKQKRTTPTVTVSGQTHFRFNTASANNNSTAVAAQLLSIFSLSLQVTVASGLTTSDSGLIDTQSSGYIDVNSEL